MAHQTEGVAFLSEGRRGLLAFEQGLGKTLVAIMAFCDLRAAGRVDRMLVICPNSLKRNWVAELNKFAPTLTVDIAEGTPKARRTTLSMSRCDVMITSYETARSELTALLAFTTAQRTALVLDESHAAKNWKSLTSASMRHIAPRCEYRWLLSGTPVTNTPADLYTQIEIVAPGERSLGSLETFLARIEEDPTAAFAKPIFDDLILRKTKEECLDLPEKTFTDVIVELPAWQRRLYDDMRHDMACAIKGMTGAQYSAFASTALAQLTRLMQLASNPALIFPDTGQTPGKVDVLDGLLADIMALDSRKVILWSNYVANIERLRLRYSEYGAVAIYGGVPPTERQNVANAFQGDAATRLLIANPAAAATGFTLTAANYTIYESIGWRYDHYAQSQDRNHRIGQTRPVTYLRLIAADTIDEAIGGALERKSSMAKGLLSDPDVQVSLSKLTPTQMCALILNNELP
ncbi:MAG: DEAD/DEAH box helicase [Brevundimonas sp.]